ncbi:MAG: CDP-glucose 4,6-dehydratase [Oceanibulbus sp.]|nr:CDP-glucose 4,6-dehydratase [Sulfitobacter sp.]
MPTRDFWLDQRVFLTGHTGFKGSWTARWLSRMGATQVGYAREPNTDPALFPALDIPGLTSVIGDICDPASLVAAVKACDPTIAIHMAAQPLVRLSYREPVETYASNVMGTLNVLDALRLHAPNLKAVLVITTDKVYRNDDSGHAFVEDDALGGHDPYSSSKAACEEVVSCYRQSYYNNADIPLVTARAGNVVGGGDWSEDRLVPDIWRAMVRGDAVELRNPLSVRPWQHVLDPVSGYLDYVQAIATRDWADQPRALNFAPAADCPMTVQEVTETLGAAMGIDKPWRLAVGAQPIEMNLLTLDASLAKRSIGWEPKLTGRQAIEWTAEWMRQTQNDISPQDAVDGQIDQYEALLK